ncbi:MAG: choice-of-anchor D domain-containing protein [Bacteroidaceae bacterium]|nr:choice-of-anchor D domain-containing protein [Bacteroidaceae bacterium]
MATANITDQSAQVSWTSDGDKWNLNYKVATEEDWITENNLISKSYNITSLTAETEYQVRVQTVDGDNVSDWSSISFTTKPAPITSFPYSETFNGISSGIPANWDNSEGTTINDSYKWSYYATGQDGAGLRFNSYNNQNGIWNVLKTPAMNLPADKVMQLSFWYKNPTGGDFSVYISNDGGDSYTTSLATGLTGQSAWKQIELSIPDEFKNNVVIVFKGTSNYGSGDAYIYLDGFMVKEAPMEAKLDVETESIAFGMVAGTSSQDVVIKNSGAANMTGVTISYAATTGAADAITITPTLNNSTINANNQQTITVAVNTANVGAFSGTISIEATDQTTVEIPVSGYTLDNTKINETFTSAAPSHWTEYAYKSGYSTYNWNYSADGAYNTNENSTLTTPKINVTDDESLVIYAKLRSSATYGYLIIEGSTDGGETWTAYTKKLDYSAFGSETNIYKLITLDDIDDVEVEGKKINKLRVKCYYAYLKNFNGFTYAPDPVLSLYSDEDCTVAQTAAATKNFGFVTTAQQQKYYIKNTGTGQIDLTIIQADGFTTTVDETALTENEKATLTINMAATEGLHDGTMTVTAKNHDTDEVLGTFTVTLNGAVAGSKNDIDFVGDELAALPAGWESATWSVTNSQYVGIGYNSGAAGDLTSQTYTVGAGETLLFEAKAQQYQTGSLSYSYKAGSSEWTEATAISGLSNSEWKVFAISGIAAGQAKVKFAGQYVQIRRIYGFTALVEPFMEFAEAGTTKNFGMVTANTTSDAYTITNSGTAKLENLSVTCDNANFEIAVTDDANEIAANGGTATFTVTLKNTTKGSQTGTVTISGDDVTAKTFTVKGYVADDTKIFETFTSLPSRWTNTGNYWSFSANGATATSSSSKLETPKIVVAEGQKLAISAMQRYSGSSYYVTINGSSDNGATWTAYTKKLDNTQLNNTEYTVVELDDIPTTVNKLQFVGYYVYVNGLNGFTYDDNDPEFAVYSDSEFSSELTSGSATNSWGFVTENKTATYYIKNVGTGTMTLTKSDAPAGFTAALGKTSLGAGESTSLTISMENDADHNEGYHAGDIVLTAKDSGDNTLGTFTVTSSGVVVGDKTDINFTTLDAFPAGWDGGTYWSVTANTSASVGWNSGTLTTGTYTVAAGESMSIKAKKQYNSGTLSYQYSTDGGETWSASQGITPSSTSYEIVSISGIPAGSAKIKFTGTYIDIERIYGYTAVLEPVMTLSPAAASYDFGMQIAAADYEITVTNSGTAAMANMTAALSGTDAADYEVALSVPDGSTATITDGKANIPVGQTIKVTATLKASTEYKEHNATLTISADGVAGKTINLSGKTRDASKWYVDFASEIPSSFVETGSWSVSSQTARTTASDENSLITQPINLAAGEKVFFDAYNPYSGSLKVRYSVNGGISWSDYVDYTAAINTSGSTFSSHEIDLDNDAAVTAIIEFKGRYYIQLDNIYGGELNNTASMIQVKESTTAVESGVTKAFGSIKEEATATYTIKNVGNGTLTITSPVTVTGAATAAVSATSLANGESATLTITMPIAAPYEYKEGAVTVETSLGNFVINYNATILNPNALDEQFASGQPSGWYFGGYWKVYSAQAMQEDTATPQDLITEQLAVAGSSDVLTFQAARTSSNSAPTFKVYTSQDRVDWTEVDLSSLTLTTSYQDVNISGLAAGDYYVKISGARVKVDNFLGWTKKNNTRDLYVTTSTFPATTTKGNDATISATVTSLIAAETGVYAKLFIDGATEAEQTAEAQDIALNGTKTFSFTYAIPENKTAQIKIYYSDDSEAFATAENAMKVSYALSEEVDPETISAGTFNLTLSRAFNAESWNSLCLPFAVADVSAFFGDGSYAYAFTGYTDGTLNFTKVDALTAGTPYIVYVKDEKADAFTLNDVTLISTAGMTEQNGVVFRGTFAPIAADGFTANGKAYGLTPEAKIAPLGAAATSKGFRAYFDIPTGASVKALVFDDGLATSVKTIDIDTPEAQQIFDLAGRKLNGSRKGVNIINGKKVLIK